MVLGRVSGRLAAHEHRVAHVAHIVIVVQPEAAVRLDARLGDGAVHALAHEASPQLANCGHFLGRVVRGADGGAHDGALGKLDYLILHGSDPFEAVNVDKEHDTEHNRTGRVRLCGKVRKDKGRQGRQGDGSLVLLGDFSSVVDLGTL